MSSFTERLADLGFASYRDYLDGQHWDEFRKVYRSSKRPQKCVVCNACSVELHHVTYERLGAERLADVTPLCAKHHDAVHAWLKAKNLWVDQSHRAIESLKPVKITKKHKPLPVPEKRPPVKVSPAAKKLAKLKKIKEWQESGTNKQAAKKARQQLLAHLAAMEQSAAERHISAHRHAVRERDAALRQHRAADHSGLVAGNAYLLRRKPRPYVQTNRPEEKLPPPKTESKQEQFLRLFAIIGNSHPAIGDFKDPDRIGDEHLSWCIKIIKRAIKKKGLTRAGNPMPKRISLRTLLAVKPRLRSNAPGEEIAQVG